MKNIQLIFMASIVLSLIFLANNFYESYQYKHNDIPDSYKKRIESKEKEILYNMKKYFGIEYKFPLIITDKIKGRLYGLTSYDNGKIKIYLNKNVMRESIDYMVNSVIAHEYAHALLFKLRHFTGKNGGHTKEWKQTCERLGGVNCQRYVDQKEIVMGKLPF